VQVKPKTPVTNVLLVHGAWMDGSRWAKVIPALRSKGLNVVSVQIPLTSISDDVAATKRAIALADGPVLLVGHFYGGVVITEAGNYPKVTSLPLRRMLEKPRVCRYTDMALQSSRW
jgi:pimeloyl-ACP methyl ester carboxylesterase